MLTFRTPPSDDHFFSVFSNRIKHIPGLATTMALLKRIPYGHMDKNLQFLKDACRALVEEIRTEARPKAKAKAKAKPKTQPAAAAPEKGKVNGKGKGKGKGKRTCWHFNNAPAGCQGAPSAPSCTSPRRWLRRWMPRALLLSRMLRARSASRLTALALSDKPGRRRRQLSRRLPRASQCGFWIPVQATTWSARRAFPRGPEVRSNRTHTPCD